MKRVFILGACRTPIGKFGGVLASLSSVDLGAIVIQEALKRSCVTAKDVDHVYMGNVLQAGSGQNVARQAAIKAGLPYTTTAETLNIVCGSGLDAVNSAARLIRSGDADVVVAGGTESMSNAPFALRQARFGYRMGSPMFDTPLVDIMVNDGLWDAVNNYHMGITAENIAKKYSLSRKELDAFAVESQDKASAAIADGRFKDEIVTVIIEGQKNNIVVDTDEGPRPGTTAETLSKLKPAFKKDGLVTAGNSSGINDGAAAMVLASEAKVKELGLKPEAEWLGGTLDGVDPALMGLGPIKSTEKLFGKLRITMDDMDLVEVNEAFAAQSIVVQRKLGIPESKLNINGGAIALGHPIGASGCRILVTLMYELKRNEKKTGLATLCIGGGMGCSTVIAV
ncbi:MAG: acetyl-CoA C-acetyltransferase [Hungatella sp.]|jgi:acetyl-CoA C-acetyltransferase|nr:acetyl-CoA C-acetyltransferase [Hungatella sp.]